jgi:alkanesulfonate monooxygenase SsuD/methylene tetrahydromethanopterin reductase-like flavin-dependent oxidoreductase (luciferase family)
VTSFGLMTAPSQVTYRDLLTVWQDADALGVFDHAWLYDHLMPLGGDPLGPAFEGWTLLAALAAQTQRLQIGLMVTSNRFRPPALLAKMAAGVDVVSGGRLVLGIGVGSRPDHPLARREYLAHDIPFGGTEAAVTRLDEACTVIRRLWTAEEPFDFHGKQVDLIGAFCNPKPLRRTPILIGGRAKATLRLVAKHADVWNIPGGDLPDCVERSAIVDRYCTDIGRAPAEVTRSVALPASYDRPGDTRAAVRDAVNAGFDHIVLVLPAPYPDAAARWVADEVVARS